MISIDPSLIQGSLSIPPSKSHTLRALLFALLAEGTSLILNPLLSPDTEAMIRAITQFGASIQSLPDGSLSVRGVGKNLSTPNDVIDCGNSGLTLRLIAAIAALKESYTILTGDSSIRSNRSVAPLVSGLTQLGAFATTSRGGPFAPLIVRGVMRPGIVTVEGKDSQPISALLIAASVLNGTTTLHVTDPKETAWIDVTLSWLKFLGIAYKQKDYSFYEIEGGAIAPFTYRVPGDLSSAAFPIGAALVTGGSVEVRGLDTEDCQGDLSLFPLLQSMGANLSIEKEKITVRAGSKLQGREIDLDPFVDALPILAVLACFAQGTTTLVNGAICREKESDRIAAIAKELKKMGAIIKENPDGLTIQGSSLQGASLESYRDHRIAMALIIASLGAKTPSSIDSVESIQKTFPNFVSEMKQLGASLAHSDRL